MARTSAFMFTNTTAGTHDVTPVALGVTTNYALSTDKADEAVLNNKTAPIDAMEIISYRARDISKVNHNLNLQNPPKVNSGIQYGVQIEETLVTTDSTDSSFRLDEPIVVSISIRHPKSGNISNTQVSTAFTRALSALMRADGTWRFDDLMRSAERPVVD